MNLKLDRIISLATLIAAVAAIVLVLRRPAPVAPQPATVIVERAPASSPQQPTPVAPPQSSAPAYTPLQAPAPVASGPAGPAPAPAPQAANGAPANSEAISAMLAKMTSGGAAALSPDSNVGSGEPNIKDQQVTYDGDIVHGKFLTQIAGKDVWVTISGKMGEKDGYATFDPTEFKVGDTSVPVSLVNPMLQQKLAEERDRLKVPDNNSK